MRLFQISLSYLILSLHIQIQIKKYKYRKSAYLFIYLPHLPPPPHNSEKSKDLFSPFLNPGILGSLVGYLHSWWGEVRWGVWRGLWISLGLNFRFIYWLFSGCLVVGDGRWEGWWWCCCCLLSSPFLIPTHSRNPREKSSLSHQPLDLVDLHQRGRYVKFGGWFFSGKLAVIWVPPHRAFKGEFIGTCVEGRNFFFHDERPFW